MLRRRTRVAEAVFVTRAGCSMCAEALPVVERLTREAGVALTVRDVDSDPGLALWSDHVPVVLLDGVEHSRWWVDEAALRKAL
jgi:glutaredoxin